MDLRRLQVFNKVYECRSFSRAAEEVLLSQPTVSGHIKSLEDELGVRLFDRLGREILPTRAAEILHTYAARILEQVDEAQRAVDSFLGRLSGVLLLGGSTIPGQYILPALIGKFRTTHPEVRVNLMIGDASEVAERVMAGRVELGVVGATLEEDRLSFTPLMEDTLTVAAWPGHPLEGRELTLAELASQPMVVREAGSGTHMSLIRALATAGIREEDLDVVAQMGSTMAVMQAVRARVGLGIVSRRALDDCLHAGHMIELDVRGLDLKRSFYLVSRKKRTHSPAARAFIGLCLATAGVEGEA